MGQILGQDRIATPSHSSGTITLPPSLLTLGGRQYRTSALSRLISADVTLAANTLYFVYAQIVSGVPALRISLSAPSIYRVSNPTAMLISAFLSNNLSPVGFGGFFNNIDGMPETDWFTLNNTIGGLLIGSSVNPTYGTVQSNIAKGKRIGREFHLHWDYKQTAAGSTGTGSYYIICPHPVDYTYHKASNAHTWSGEVGTLGVIEETSGAYAGVNRAYFPGGTTDRISAFISMGNGTGVLKGDWGSGYSHFNVAQITFGLQVKWAVQNWGNTPLKDL